MNQNIKTQAFKQGIYEISSTQKETLGCLRVMADGRKFRYAKATAVALIPGVCLQCAAPTANHINRSAVATAIGSQQVTFTVVATEVTADMYKDGYLQVNAGTAGTLGRQYRIKSHTTVTSAGGSITVQLDEPLGVALIATTDKLSLIPNPFNGVSEGAVQKPCAGIAPVPVTASYYFWAQTGGVAAALLDNATAVGSNLIPAASGGVKLFVVDYLQPVIGYALGVGVTNEYKPMFLTID